ncbi:MAG: TRIC cation channel family protein [Streptosporangiaceae bacterium]
MSTAATVFQTLNLIAITGAALIGSTAARRRGLDPVGILSCAFITGLGGSLIRGGVYCAGTPSTRRFPARWRRTVTVVRSSVFRPTRPAGDAGPR